MEIIKKLASNIKRFLVLYSLLAITTGWLLGIKFSSYASLHKGIYSNLIVLFVFFMIYPMYLHFIAKGSNIHVPMNSILKSILIVVILPMILGYITRIFIIKFKGKKGLKNIKPLTD
ncbi:hypothetical protein [Marinitoga aeolica]|uniref:Uncharacterized protein n=1 Tax=Marinitoga aeolica TaxID=2809031 RepID=A0ABY8PNV6_9BACT|nr:hypothetical protein [Marinitoga aeolica]WGS64326.1 hypothetical protein JRV97_08085 [Marinitoga aeolica]